MPTLTNAQRPDFHRLRADAVTPREAHALLVQGEPPPRRADGPAPWSAADDLGPLIDALGRLALKAEASAGAAALVAGRGLIAEAARLMSLRARSALADGSAFEDLRPELSREEWMAKYGASG